MLDFANLVAFLENLCPVATIPHALHSPLPNTLTQIGPMKLILNLLRMTFFIIIHSRYVDIIALPSLIG